MNESIVTLPLETAEHVFVLRHDGRAAAAAIGCDDADQVRFATALSELGRETVARGGVASAEFVLEHDGAVVVTITGFPRAALETRGPSGIDAARKLIGDVHVESAADPERVRVLVRRPGVGGRSVRRADLRAALVRTAAPSEPLERLRTENADLVSTLGELRANREQLVRLNGELEETNRGVMAMYAQLSDELDETNRGVVALYAELDDKTVRLNDASEAKSRFLASVSHELRGPVNSLLGLGRLLLEPDGDPVSDDQRKQLQLMLRSGGELLALVNELLDLAKAESGRLEPAIAPVDLGDVFAELRGALRPLVRSGVKLIVDAPESEAIETDPKLLSQVLRNLLTNAVKFTTHGEIRMTAVRTETYEVTITVRDTGIGIAREDRSRIFEEFFQVRGVLQAEQKGTGLGLPYAKRVTETLGGTMTVESEPGRGSTFTVRLPVAWQPLLTSPTSPPAVPPVEPDLGTVLIVDDDEAFRTVLRGLLQGTARHVIEAPGGAEGLRLMREQRPELAFIDLRMPDMDAPEVLDAKSADPNIESIPVVIVTATQLSRNARATFGRGAILLAKPSLTRELVHQAIADALAATGAR